jgi:hypothetical protein
MVVWKDRETGDWQGLDVGGGDEKGSGLVLRCVVSSSGQYDTKPTHNDIQVACRSSRSDDLGCRSIQRCRVYLSAYRMPR